MFSPNLMDRVRPKSSLFMVILLVQFGPRNAKTELTLVCELFKLGISVAMRTSFPFGFPRDSVILIHECNIHKTGYLAALGMKLIKL